MEIREIVFEFFQLHRLMVLMLYTQGLFLMEQGTLNCTPESEKDCIYLKGYLLE